MMQSRLPACHRKSADLHGRRDDPGCLSRRLGREPAPAKARVQISGTLRLTATYYYFFGGARIAMRVGANVTFLHGDRLGSASLATDAAGNVLSQERYYVWGSASMMSGTMPTDFQWQNQRRLDESQAGKLYDFNARFFTPVAARFISPDSIGLPPIWWRGG